MEVQSVNWRSYKKVKLRTPLNILTKESWTLLGWSRLSSDIGSVWKEDDELNVFQTPPVTCYPQYNNSKKTSSSSPIFTNLVPSGVHPREKVWASF